jgi:hypothetical protein
MTDTVTALGIAELTDTDLTYEPGKYGLVPVEGIRTQRPHQTVTDSTTELNRPKMYRTTSIKSGHSKNLKGPFILTGDGKGPVPASLKRTYCERGTNGVHLLPH